jgi:hypothetical protein
MDIREKIKKELDYICHYPIVFVASIVVAIIVLFTGFKWFYAAKIERIESESQLKDSKIIRCHDSISPHKILNIDTCKNNPFTPIIKHEAIKVDHLPRTSLSVQGEGNVVGQNVSGGQIAKTIYNVSNTGTVSRKLSADQINEIQNLLNALGPHKIIIGSYFGDAESHRFADQLNNIFGKSKWSFGNVNTTFLDDPAGDVTIASSSANLLPVAFKIINTLNSIGIKSKYDTLRQDGYRAAVDDNMLLLVVGTNKQE